MVSVFGVAQSEDIRNTVYVPQLLLAHLFHPRLSKEILQSNMFVIPDRGPREERSHYNDSFLLTIIHHCLELFLGMLGKQSEQSVKPGRDADSILPQL